MLMKRTLRSWQTKSENERTSLDQFEERIPSELHAWNGDTWRLDRPSPNCAFLAICTPVSIFFGTDRAQEKTPERIEFSWDSGAGLSLGKAIVTVP